MDEEKNCKNCGAKIEIGQEFCPKCGTQIGLMKCKKCGIDFDGSGELCTECTKKKKKFILKIGIPIIIVVVLLAIFIIWGLIISGGAFKQFAKIVSEGHYSCFLGHDYSEPNCKHGNLCKECGYETGEKGEHSWGDATCTEPKTCSVCKLTEGEALGHTTRFGKCTTCNEYVYDLEDEFLDICEAFVDAKEHIETAIDYYEDGLDSYYSSDMYFEWSSREFRDAAKDIQKAIDSCGSYKEFGEIKKQLQNTKNSMNMIDSTYDNLYTYGNQALDDFNAARDKMSKYSFVFDEDI